MATEADVPVAISISTGELLDRTLKIEKLDSIDNQCSPGTLNESKGDLDQHPEIHTKKHFADGENVQVEYSMEVESKNSFGISEGEHFLDPLSENSQVEQSIQAGMEIPKNEVQLQKDTQVGGPVETGTKENEVIKERKEKFAEIENHDIVTGAGIISEITKTGDAKLDVEEVEASTDETTVDQHVQVISNQQDSIKEDVRRLEKEADISDADIKGAEKADGNAESYHKEASDVLETTTFQEYEASISTHDVMNGSFKKDIELETHVTSNDEEDSQQTLQNYEQKEELQALPALTPEDAETESAFENAEVISCTEEAREIQNTPEFLEKEEANPVHCPKENDSITEEVSVAMSIKQETVEHALPEIQAAENDPQEFSEENSRDDQASVEAAHLSTDKDEKILEEKSIPEKSSSLVEETSQQISREEEVQALDLKEEEKEADTKCEEEPIEVADTTTEIGFETIEQRTETNKDLHVPNPKEEAYAEKSTEAVEENSSLSEVSEVKTKEIIQEDSSTVSSYGLVSGEVSQVSALEEAEAENKEHVNNTPEQKGPQNILTDEMVVETEDHAQEGGIYNSETTEKDIQTTEDEGNADAGIAPAEGLATIIADQSALPIEDIELQTEENVNSIEKLEEKIPEAEYEGGKGMTEAKTENNEQVTDTTITSEENDPETTLTDETGLGSKDIDVQEERNLSSEENLEKQLPVVEDKGDTCLKEAEEEKEHETPPTIITREPPLDIEVIDEPAEERFSPKEKLEELIPAAADEGDTGLKEAEEENKEQVKSTDSAPEEKVTILTDERALDTEEVELKVEENVGSKDYMNEQIPTTTDKGDTGLMEPGEDNKESVSVIDISPDEKGLATILTDETTHDAEDIDVKEGECINSEDIETESYSMEPQEENKEKVTYTDITPEEKIVNSHEQLEEQVLVVADEGDTCLNEAEEENKENIKSKETCPEEKGQPIISTDETALDCDEIELQFEEKISSTDNLKKHIPTPADEAECGLTEAESEYKERAITTDITPEEKGVATILTDERSLETEDTNVQAKESANSNQNLEEEITAAPEMGDTCLKKEDKEENKEQVESSSHEEKGLASILTGETSQDLEYADVKVRENFDSEEIMEKQIPAVVYEGETDLKEVEAENKEQVETTEIATEEKGLPTILVDETAKGIEFIDGQAGEINSKEVLEKQIPTALDEGGMDSKEAEADIKEQVETTDIVPDQKGVETLHVQELGNFNSIETTVGEDETDLNEGEVENKEQVKCTEIAAEVKDATTILRDETALGIQDVEEKPDEAGKGEDSVEVLDDIPVTVHKIEQVDEATMEQSYQETSHEAAEPKITIEDGKSEDHPERNHMTVEEVLDEPKISSRDFSEDQIIEGIVKSSTLESIEESTVKSSEDNEKEIVELKEEGSCTGNTNEENASDHIPEYIPEKVSEQIKDEDYNAVKSENEILEDSQTIEVDEACETKNIEKSEEILSTLPVNYDEGQQGEGCSPAPTEALKEENINEDTLSVQVATDDGNSDAVTITETSAEGPSNDEEDSPEVLQKYEPEEEITKLPDVKPEETTPGPSSENVEVITCTKEEIQESLNNSSGQVLETTTTEALPEIQIVETVETDTELKACVEAAELSTEGEKENSVEKTTCEVSSSLIVEKSEESSKEEEEKTEGYIECKDSVEEATSETLKDTAEQKPISEEESNSIPVEDKSVSLETSEKEIEKGTHGECSYTIRSFDSEVVMDETGLTETTIENKELMETTQITSEENGNEVVGETGEPSSQVQNLDGEATPSLEVEDETEKSANLLEKNDKICEEVIDEPNITERDFNEITEGHVTNLTIEPIVEHETIKDCQSEEKETEKLSEEGSCVENVNEGNANDISTESAEDKDVNLKECIEETLEIKEQITEGSMETFTPESVEEDTDNNSQDSEKEAVELKDEGSCKESIKEENASELSPKYKEDALKSEEEVLENSQSLGDDENSTCQPHNVERSEETVSTLPAVQLLLQKLVQENIDEDTVSVQETKDGDDGAVTITETSAEAPSNDEDDLPHVLQKSEPEEELTKLPDISPEEMKPESSTENAEVVTSSNVETQESLDKGNDTKESDTSTGEVCTVAADESSIEGEKEEQTTQEVSSSTMGEVATEGGSKEGEKKEAHEECIAASEVIEISNKTLVEDASVLLEASDKVVEKEIQGEYSSTVRSFDSEVVSDDKGLTEAREEMETIEEKESQGTDIYNTELVGESVVEPFPQVQTHEEVAEDETDKSYDHPEKSEKICEEVLDEPKIIDRDFPEEQTTEEIVTSCAGQPVEEGNCKDDQADKKERSSKEEGSSIDNIKEGNASEVSTECVPEVVEECTRDAVESKEEALEESPKDEVSVAKRTEEVTSREVEVSNLALEKLDSEAPKENCEVVPESESKGIDVVAQDEVIVDQKLDEGVLEEPSTLLSEEQELRDSEHDHQKEAQVPRDSENDIEDLMAAEEPRELKVSELAVEKLNAGETEEESKEICETVSKDDSRSVGVISEDEIISDQTRCEGEKELEASELAQETLDADAPEGETKDGSAVVPKLDPESLDDVKEELTPDQTLPEVVSTRQLQSPSTALLPEEKEPEASEYEHETKSVDKNTEEENPKEVEVPANEDKQESFTVTPTETCLHTEEPKHTESALQKLDASETKEEIKGTSETVTTSDRDDIVADQTVCEEIKETPLSEERELGASELALNKPTAVDIEEIKEGPEGVPKFDSGLIEVVSNDETTIDETFNEGIIKEPIQSPSSTLLPEEKEHSEPENETTTQDRSTEQECTKEVEVSANEDTQALLATRPVEKECLQKEEPSELSVPQLALEKLDAGDTEESNGTFETVSRSDFPSIVADPKEEIIVDETLSKGVTDIPVEIPSYASVNEEKEPKASELLEKVDADTPEEVEGSEVIPQSVCQSSCEVSKDEIIADQLEIPSASLLSDEKDLKASEHEHETIIDEKNLEDENLKEVKEPTDEASDYVFVGRSVDETCLQKEQPSDLKVPEANGSEEVKETFETVSESDPQSSNAVSKDDSIADQTVSDVITDMPLDIPLLNENEEVKEDAIALALEKLDTDGTEEVKEGSELTPKSDRQSIDTVVNHEIITNHVLPESITKEQLLVQPTTSLPDEKELKETEHEHGTATQDKNLEEAYTKGTEVAADEETKDLFVASPEEATHLQKEDSRELKVSELSPECEEEITSTFESTDADSKEETIAGKLLHQHDEELLASPTLVPEEEEEATVHKEELEEYKVLELSLKGETEEETKEAFEPASDVSSQSIGELATDETVDQIPPSSLIYEGKRCENITTINNAGEECMNVVEAPNDESRQDPNSAEETSIPNEEPRKPNVSNVEFPSSQYTERGSSNEEKSLEVATSHSRAEDLCETPIEANQTAKFEVPNEEIKGVKEVAKDSQLIAVDENVRDIQQKIESGEEKYPEKKNDTFTAPTEYYHKVPEVDETGSLSGDIEKEVKPDVKSPKNHSPNEAEGMNCESSTTQVMYPVEKDSSTEISQGVLDVEEANGTTQDKKQLEKESHATDIPSSKDEVLNFVQGPKLEDTKPSNETLVATESKEENFCESGTEKVESTFAQISLSERLMEESTKERVEVTAHLAEEKDPTVVKELQAHEEEEEDHEEEEEDHEVEETKTDEEKEDTEHKRAYQGYDEPVIVEASRDSEVKVSPKKSHNILSGMGKSVKHSISKVKKAIIGKSSTSKTQSEK